MTFQLLSDLHLEFDENYQLPEVKADFLFLAGDIGNPYSQIYQDFLADCSCNYEKVFLITGNHEYYGGQSEDEVHEKIRTICESLSNVHFLNEEEHHLNDDVVILGCTLWSEIRGMINFVSRNLSDFSRISFFDDKNNYNRLFEAHKTWLLNKFEEHSDKKIIVLTHHLPSYSVIHQVFKGSPINCAFASSLDKHIVDNPSIIYWLCGHSHKSNTVTIGSTTCILNPRGYPNDETEWDMNTIHQINQ